MGYVVYILSFRIYNIDKDYIIFRIYKLHSEKNMREGERRCEDIGGERLVPLGEQVLTEELFLQELSGRRDGCPCSDRGMENQASVLA